MRRAQTPEHYVGINKSVHYSGACLITGPTIELRLKERFSRKNKEGGWPLDEVKAINHQLAREGACIGEHALGEGVLQVEQNEQESNHLYENLLTQSLTRFSSQFNHLVEFVPHHRSHAAAALAVSPFEKSILVVMDDGGSFHNSFFSDHPEILKFPPPKPSNPRERVAESLSVYFQEGENLSCVLKEWQTFVPPQASRKAHSEEDLLIFFKNLKQKFPKYENLIFTGTAALNGAANMKIVEQRLFANVFIPPFPGDESIPVGVAFHCKAQIMKQGWQRTPFENQTVGFGPFSSIPGESQITETFSGFEISKPEDVFATTARMLAEGKVIGWFQDRSEPSSHALGNRSVLLSPLHTWEGLRTRSFGLSCLWDLAHEYFHVAFKFDSPFMSFAPRVRAEYKERFIEAIDERGLALLQTVRETQNPKFYKLLTEFGIRTDLFCLVNANMCLPDEPLVETVSDARRFLDNSGIDALVIGQLMITKKAGG